jgi:hypothetical protein
LYERLWSGFWFVVVAFGVALAVLEWSAMGLLLTLGPLVVLFWVVQSLLPDLVPGWSRWSTGRRALPQSLMMAIGILTVWSFGRVSPPLGLLVVLTAGLSSPAVVRRVIRSARGSTARAPVRGATDPLPAGPQPEDGNADSRLTQPEAMGPLKGLDDRQLCRLWRESFWVLHNPASPGTLLCLVALREACLDELERRDAAALHAWLDSGARASSGPEKYLTPRRRGSAAESHPSRGDPG